MTSFKEERIKEFKEKFYTEKYSIFRDLKVNEEIEAFLSQTIDDCEKNVKESLARWFEDGLNGEYGGKSIGAIIRNLKEQ